MKIFRILIVVFYLVVSKSALLAQCTGNEPPIELGNDTILCQGQTLNLVAALGYDYYQWSTGSFSNQITVNSSGTYVVSAGLTGNNLILNGNFQGGTTAVANNFTSSYIPGTGGTYGLLSNEGQYAVSTSPSLVHNNFMNCGDHTTGNGNMLIANGAATPNTIVWSQTVTVAPNTNYAFSFWQMNVLNTNATSNLQLYINNAPISAIVPTNPTACVWDENTGFWNSGSSTSAVLSIVNQSVVGSGNDFAIDDIFFAPICLVEDSIAILYDTIQVNAGLDIVFCANETGNLNATANTNVVDWNWSNGATSPNINPQTSGIYTITATSENGCDATDDVNVSITPMNWNIDDVFIGPADCGLNNGYVSAVTSGTFNDPPSYTWTGPGPNNPNFINASVWTDLAVGWYYLEIESAGCYMYDSAYVTPNNPPNAVVTANPISGFYPLTVNFQNTSQNSTSYFWNFGNGQTANVNDLSSQQQTFDTTGTYTVMLVAQTGNCFDTTFIQIEVLEPPVIPPVLPVGLEATNVFSPNGDGKNDYYEFKLLNIIELELTILNRWGQVVFESKDINTVWDGKSQNGDDAADGVYFYKFKAVGLQNEPFEGHGFLHLVR
jgi:gliding motility-associated-like protein